MSYKTNLIKMAVKLTPNKLIIFVGNIVLKGIAELKDFDFDITGRKAYVQVQLYGETEVIEVQIKGFAVIKDETGYKLVIQQAKSNRLWLGNLLSRIIGKIGNPRTAANFTLSGFDCGIVPARRSRTCTAALNAVSL